MTTPNERLTSFIQRIEALAEEKAGIAGDISEVFAEAKSAGFDTKVMRLLIRERKMDAADRQEQAALLEVYREALGMLRDTPLGNAAMGRAAAAPGVRRAMKELVDSVPAGSSMTISTAGSKGVTIAKDAAGNVIRDEPSAA